MTSTPDSPRRIVIVGGGIIGCTTAYYLSRHPSYSPQTHQITLLEASTVAGGASGKAGGLLAKWAYPTTIVPLSYKLHAELAKEHNGAERWGYRTLYCGELEARGRLVQDSNGKANGNGTKEDTGNANDKANVSLQKRDKAAQDKLRASGFPADLDWIAPESALGYEVMGDPSTTAQVHPYQFTTSIAALAKEAGVEVIEHALVQSINKTTANKASPRAESVTYLDSSKTSHTLAADTVVLTAGAWSSRLHSSVPVSGLRAHSVVIRPRSPVSPYALFTQIRLPKGFPAHKSKRQGDTVGPEIYARPGREIYACGEGDSLVPLPATTADVEVDPGRCNDIVNYCRSISDELGEGEVTARQACYLPVAGPGAVSSGPWIGHVKDCDGLVVATGHTCWGIQNAPGTGKCVSELVMDGAVKSTQLGSNDAMKSL